MTYVRGEKNRKQAAGSDQILRSAADRQIGNGMLRRQAHGLIVFLLLIPSMASALGLGSVETRSALNEPLDARIPLTASSGELENLRVSLAPAEAFQRARLDRPFLLSRLNFEVVTDDGAQPYVKVTTENSLREPFLAFLVDVRWSGGRLLREYTLLLDPPVYAPRQQAPGRAAQATSPRAADLRSSGATTAPGRVSQPDSVAESRSEPASDESPGEYGAVQRNETAWDIAMAVRPGNDVSVHQMMMALVRANPDAFIDGNVNSLRSGAILRIPPRSEIQSLSVADARREFSRQFETWRAGRTPAPVEPTPSPAEATDGESSVAAAQEVPEGRLHVVAASQESGTDATASLTDDELDVTAQNMRRLQQEITSLRESEAEMRAENEELRRMAAEMRQRMQALERSLNIPVDPAVAQPSTNADPDMVEEAPGGSNDTAETASSDEAEPAASDQPEQTATPRESAPPPVVESVVAEPQAPWENPMLQMLGAAVLLVLLALLMLVMRRRRQARAEDEAMLSASASGLSAAGDDWVEENSATGTAMAGAAGGLDDDDLFVDPVEQAKTHMENGNFDDAADAINRGLAVDPDNPDLYLKLLEIHARNQDRSAFEADAQRLFGLVHGQSDPVWQRASELGREIAPENPLFSSGDEFDGSPLDESLSDDNALDAALNLSGEDVGTEPARPQEAEPPETAAGPEAEDLSDLDFSLDDPVEDEQPLAATEPEPAPRQARPEQAEPEAALDDLSMDFDLGSFSDSGEGVQDSSEDEPAAPAEVDDDHFGLEFDAPESTPDSGAVADVSKPIADSNDEVSSFDFEGFDSDDAETEGDVATAPVGADEGGDEDELFDNSDESGTKLDLARAYLDMGDAEGARSLLEEVIEEGSDEQKQEAQAMMDQAK